jgi:hypothetical protein
MLSVGIPAAYLAVTDSSECHFHHCPDAGLWDWVLPVMRISHYSAVRSLEP